MIGNEVNVMSKQKKIIAVLATVLGIALIATLLLILLPLDRADAAALPFYDEKEFENVGTTIYFEAEVLEVGEEQILVAPLESTKAQMAFDCVLVNTTMVNGERVDGFEVGQKIGILFDGKVAMSLPAQVLAVYGFFATK